MKQLYDEFDAQDNIVQRSILLVPGLQLPEGHYWKEHTISLSEIQQEKLTYIENIRNEKCFTPISVLGHTWQVDSRSQTLLTSAILMAEIGVTPTPPYWRSLDNIDVPVTLNDLKSIAAATAGQTQYAYSKSWQLKAAVMSATSVEEANLIEWV